MHRAVACDVEHQERTLCYAGYLHIDTRVTPMNLIVRQEAHCLGTCGGEALESVDGGHTVDDAGEIGAINPTSDNVRACEHIKGHRIPNEIGTIFCPDHLKARLPGLQIGQEITLVAKHRDPNGAQRRRS